MCFGNTATTGTKTTDSTQTTTPSPWLTNAAANNVQFAQNLQSTGFTPYSGQQVADFSPQQSQSFGMGNGIAGSITPDVQLAGGALANYTTAGPQSVTPSTISSQMSPYMNQYVSMALQPQLQQAANTYMLQSQAQQGAATSAGAFGDPRAGMLQSNLGLNYALENQGLVGNAYNAAFNTAIGAGAQDVSNNLNAQTTNANLAETALSRQLTGANAIYGQGTGAANLQNTFGQQQTAQSQAGLNANYNQWLMAQQYPFQTSQLLNSDLSAAQGVSPTTTTGNSTQTSTAPDNSGWGMLGSLAGTVGGAIIGGPIGASIGGSIGGAVGGGVGGGKAADGGAIPSDEATLIGERGPELFVPHQAGTVISYEALKAALANKKSVSTTDAARHRQEIDGGTLARQLGVPAMANGGMFTDASSMLAPSSAAPVNSGAGFGGGMLAPAAVAPAPTASFAPSLVAPPVTAPTPGTSVGPMIMHDPGPVTPPSAPAPQGAPSNLGISSTVAPQAAPSSPLSMQPGGQPAPSNPAMMQRLQQFMQQRQAQAQNGGGQQRPQFTPQQIQQWQTARAAQQQGAPANTMAGRGGSFGGGPVQAVASNNQQAPNQALSPQQRWQQMLQSGGFGLAA